jgi:hypothetical protein
MPHLRRRLFKGRATRSGLVPPIRHCFGDCDCETRPCSSDRLQEFHLSMRFIVMSPQSDQSDYMIAPIFGTIPKKVHRHRGC